MKIKDKIIDELYLFEHEQLTNNLIVNIREVVFRDDEEEEEEELETPEVIDGEEEEDDTDNVVKTINPITKEVEPVDGTAQPSPKLTTNKKPQVKPIPLTKGGEVKLTGRDKGLKLGNSDVDIIRVIDSDMMVKIHYKPKSNNPDNSVYTYNGVIYVLGVNLRGKKAIRVFNPHLGRNSSESGWKTFLVSNIMGINVSGLNMGKKAISDYLSNSPRDGREDNEGDDNGDGIQGYNHNGDKSFVSIIHSKKFEPTIKNIKI